MKEYLDLVNYVLTNGKRRQTRSGEVLSCFSYQYSFDLSGGAFPLLTTKKINFNNIYHELMWFLSGSENLTDFKGNKEMWAPWSIDGWYLPEIYGKQWTEWEYQWFDGEETHTAAINQIAELIWFLKEDPNSRRHIVAAWNPGVLHKVALPWCHSWFQCYVDDGRLDLQLYQRSADIAIGVPYNIACYALLLRLLALECGLEPGRFIHVLGDAHIYLNHVDGLKKQLEREPRPLPSLALSDIDFWDRVRRDSTDDFILSGYDPHPFIKFPLAV